MKKFLFFLVIFPLIGCNSLQTKDKNQVSVVCPRVFFSTDDKHYIDSEQDNLSIDNLSIKAELNNFAINEDCQQSTDILIIPIDILTIIKPLNIISKPQINIPIHASLLDKNDQTIETQYLWMCWQGLLR